MREVAVTQFEILEERRRIQLNTWLTTCSSHIDLFELLLKEDTIEGLKREKELLARIDTLITNKKTLLFSYGSIYEIYLTISGHSVHFGRRVIKVLRVDFNSDVLEKTEELEQELLTLISTIQKEIAIAEGLLDKDSS